MQVTARDIAILGVFCVILAAGAGVVIQRSRAAATGEGGIEAAGAARPRQDTPAEAPAAGPVDAPNAAAVRQASARIDPLSSPLAPGQVLPGFESIAQRKLFDPLIRASSSGAADVEVPQVPDADSPTQAQGPPRVTSTSNPFDSGERIDLPDGGGSSTPAKPTVAITGFLRTSDGVRVIMEDLATRRIRVLNVGAEAFGYRLREVSEDERQVVLESTAGMGGAPISLKLGEGKQAEAPRTAQSQPPSEGHGQPGGGGSGGQPPQTGQPGGGMGGWSGQFPAGFDPSTLTPEQRARYEEYMRRRRG